MHCSLWTLGFPVPYVDDMELIEAPVLILERALHSCLGVDQLGFGTTWCRRETDMEEEQNREHYAATELKDAEVAAKTEQVKGPNKEERRRTKRELNKPQYLKDYTMN
eukprot:XP_006587883.1 uncharacterized protein LOC102669163 [Glycine max]